MNGLTKSCCPFLLSTQKSAKVLGQPRFVKADLKTVTQCSRPQDPMTLQKVVLAEEVHIFVFCLPFHSDSTNHSCAPRSSLKTSTQHTQSTVSTLQDNAWHCLDVIPERPWQTKKHPLTGGEIINRLLLLLLLNEGLHNGAPSVFVLIFKQQSFCNYTGQLKHICC